MLNLAGKRVTIIGGKRSGMALIRLSHRLGASVGLSDQNTLDDWPSEFLDWCKKNNIRRESKGHSQAFVEDSDLIVLSPGVRPDALPVVWAAAKEIPVLGEIEFAAQFCTKPMIAVTGSNGKTTVVTLITKILEQAGHRPCLCGNVGLPFSNDVLDPQYDYFVLEVSSFQMEVLLDPTSPWRHEGETSSNGHLYFRGFKPMIGVLLNFSQNHLDRHKDMDEYFAAKKRLFMNQDEDDFAVLNFQDPLVRPLADDLASQIRFFNGPQSMQDWMKQNPNFSAVTRVAQILGINPTVCQKVCEEFKGVEHRMEWVRDLKGVDFINDSKSTTVEATRWALERLQRPVVMICGGRDKQMNYSVLAPLVRQKVKKMLVIGEAREKIRQSYQGVIDIVDCDSLDAAVQQANKFAQPGDCVLLSPMCASFDMFRDFEDRGKVFKEIVGRLA